MGEAANADVASGAPRDRGNLIYAIFYLLGMGSLLPWNFFIAVNSYWKYKWRNVTADGAYFPLLDADVDNATTVGNTTDDVRASEKMSPLQLEWSSYLSIASMLPNVTFLLLNAAFGHRFPTMPRLVVSQIVIICCLVFTCTTAAVTTDGWQDGFFWATIAVVVVINVMVAIFQGGLSGVAAKFPPRYMGSVVQGQGLGGIFAASVNVLSLAVPDTSEETAAFYCFLVTILFLAVAFVALLGLTRTEFFMHYYEGRHCDPVLTASSNAAAAAARNGSCGDNALVSSPEGDRLIPASASGSDNTATVDMEQVKIQIQLPREKINVLKITASIWVWILAAFVNFMIVLAVFPAITSLVFSTEYGNGNLWNDRYFIPVSCFLLFNVGDYCGRLLASSVQWPGPTKAGSWICACAAFARLAFIPLFLFCNASPANRYYTPILFHSDAAYLVLMSVFSVSTGYIGTIVMMFAPKTLPEGESQATGASIMVSFLVLGLAVGSLLSRAIVQLL